MKQVISLKCPECGATLNTDSDREYLFCEYCGTRIIVDDDSERTINIHYKETDEARIREIEAHENIELRRIEAEEAAEKRKIEAIQAEERAWEEKRSRNKKIWLIISGAATAIGILLSELFGRNFSMAVYLTGLGGSSLFYGTIYFWISGAVHRSKMRKRGTENRGTTYISAVSPSSVYNQGSLRVVRQKRFLSGNRSKVFVDNKVKGSLRNGESIVLFLDAGEHTLRLQTRVQKSGGLLDKNRSITQVVSIKPYTETKVEFIRTVEYHRHKIVSITQTLWENTRQM